MAKFWLSILILLSSSLAYSQAYRQIARDVEIATTTSSLELEEAKKLNFQKNSNSFIKMGFSLPSLWLRITLDNETTENKKSVLAIPSAFIMDNIILHQANRQAQQAGDHFVPNKQLGKYFGFYFPIELAPGPNTFYMQIRSNSLLNFALEYYPSENDFLQESSLRNSIILMAAAFVMALMLFSSFLYKSMKLKRYRFYVLWNLCTLALHCYKSGVTANFIHFQNSLYSDEGWLILVLLDLFLAVMFIKDFLSAPLREIPRIKRLIVFHSWIFPAIMPIVFYSQTIAFALILVFLSTGCTTLFVAQCYALSKRKTYYYLHSFSWFFIMLFALLVGFSIAGIVPPTFWISTSVILALCVEALLSAVALSLQAYESEGQKNLALSVKRHTLQQLAGLVYPHQIKLIESGSPLVETMPSGEADACILSFDIQGSSKLGHDRHRVFFQSVMKSCHKAMMAFYDSDQLKANAYLIKELGDGFLCSVGFPFRCEGDPYQNAVSLAEIFVEVFRKQKLKYLPGEPCFCSIGVAYGRVYGGFPTQGLKNYDLHGHGIVLATRYESFRKNLFSDLGRNPSDIVIVQSVVHENLPVSMQSDYECFVVRRDKIRDDESALTLHFRSF